MPRHHHQRARGWQRMDTRTTMGNGGTRDTPSPTRSGVAANGYQDDERGLVRFFFVLLNIITLRLLVQEPH
jgi:hypothetical protein